MIQFFCYYSKPQGFPFTFNANTRGKVKWHNTRKKNVFLPFFKKCKLPRRDPNFLCSRAADDQAFHDTFSTLLAIVMKKTTDKKIEREAPLDPRNIGNDIFLFKTIKFATFLFPSDRNVTTHYGTMSLKYHILKKSRNLIGSLA